jgi:uncharacterized protein with HEPN domain
MPGNPKKLFADVSANRTDSSRGELDAGRAIQRHCGGKTRDDYLKDELLRGFVERKLLIIGEALARLRETQPELAARIKDIDRIIGQRNRIVHGYDAVDDLLIWDAIANHLPALLAQIERFARE